MVKCRIPITTSTLRRSHSGQFLSGLISTVWQWQLSAPAKERWANRLPIGGVTIGRTPVWASELDWGRHGSVIFTLHVFIKHLSYSAGMHRAPTQIKTRPDWMSWIPMIYDIVRYFTNLPSCILIVFWRSLSRHLNGFVIKAWGLEDLPNCVSQTFFSNKADCLLNANNCQIANETIRQATRKHHGKLPFSRIYLY